MKEERTAKKVLKVKVEEKARKIVHLRFVHIKLQRFGS
jgi:hypothetical protein